MRESCRSGNNLRRCWNSIKSERFNSLILFASHSLFVTDYFDPLIGTCITESRIGERWSRWVGNFHRIVKCLGRKFSRRKGYERQWLRRRRWRRKRICRLLYERFGLLSVSRASTEGTEVPLPFIPLLSKMFSLSSNIPSNKRVRTTIRIPNLAHFVTCLFVFVPFDSKRISKDMVQENTEKERKKNSVG